MSVLLETSYGDIVVDLYLEHAPRACLNFLKLCKLKYYNDCQFFRVEKGFVAQTGDPLNTGKGGVSVFAKCYGKQAAYFEPEHTFKLRHARKGTVSMTASSGKTADGINGHGSQFFITLADDLKYLDDVHTVFGFVAEGMSVLDKIADTHVDKSLTPYRLIRIRHTIVLDDPLDDPKGLPEECPSPPPEQGGPPDRLLSDEEDGDAGERTEEQLARITEAEAAREERSRAEVLEMIGDIADADMKPPDNVLFICKLNPVTEAEDLEIIFSRFGECRADIIKDRKSNESLCYGFIEFDSRNQCERAYFKMDNALIDDRRVRVDFSQSVSKLWNAARRGQQKEYKNMHQHKTSKRQDHAQPSTAKRRKTYQDRGRGRGYQLVFEDD